MLPLILLGTAYLISRTTKSVEKYHLGGDMSKHLAPNGKPSNLTHEQWHLVRTPEFKAWFGDWENNPEEASKVVDENGEPLVVYRGESDKFNVFNPKKLGTTLKTSWRYAGFYFATNKMGAEQYAYSRGSDIVKSFFLNLRNPYTIDSNEFFDVMDWGSLPNQKFKNLKSSTDYAKNRIEEIKSNDYDGVNVKILDKNKVIEIIAFNPTQIKLADGSNTTFDGSNPDIRYARGGELKSDYIKRVKEAIKYVENSPKARMDVDFEDEEGTQEAINEGKDSKRIFPAKSKPNSFIVKTIREGVQNKYYSIGVWNEKKKSYDYKYLKNDKYGDKSKEFDTLQIATYDDRGKIVGVIKIATSENKKQDVKKGAFKISVRQDYQNKGIASKLIEKAESEGIDFVEALKNNNFTSKGRWYFISWLNKKLKNKK